MFNTVIWIVIGNMGLESLKDLYEPVEPLKI